MGILVGILSLLVTVLIGSICKVVEDKDKIKKEVLEEGNKELLAFC